MTPRPAPAEGTRLRQRIAELESERNAAHERTRVLSELTEACASITKSRERHDILERLLQSTCHLLGFGRAIYFERELGALVATLQLDGGDGASTTSGDRTLEPARSCRAAPAEAVVGHSGDLDAPLVDVRSWYVFAELANEDASHGYLYADGHACAEPRAWETRSVEALAAIAAAALQSSALFRQQVELATRDSLTGLLNRRAFDESLQQTIASCRRCSASFAIAIVDLDDLKRINDTAGHSVGDHVLQRLATALREASRSADIVGRLAGDEFGVLITDTDAELARQAVRRITARLRVDGLRCSIGVALFPKSGDDATSIMRAADAALYAVKRAGKNGFAFA